MTMERWLDGIDVDLTLIETRDDPDEPWTRRALAGASVGVDPMDAYEGAQELVEAVGLMVGGNPDGKASLARILGKGGNDYQRSLWYAVAGRGALSVAADLHWLMAVLASRAEVWLGRKGWDLPVNKQPDPYVTDRPEGPVGRFRSSFELGAHWDGIADKR
jgi:hypothetical protein